MNEKFERHALETDVQMCDKLLGVYSQKQEGMFMQRIKILGGRISWDQWRRIAHLTEEYSQGAPLHLTTRQDIELHNLRAEDIQLIQDSLAQVSLKTFGAGGDSVRNITICSACDFCRDSFDLLPLASNVEQYLEQHPDILNLPRKFKISFSGCERACAKPWFNDLGFIAQQNGLFNVIGAGSLGAKPEPGILLYENLSIGDVLPLSVAALELFNQLSNRVNRRQARFRHVRMKLGDNKFKEELHDRFTQKKEYQWWPTIQPALINNKKIRLLHRLQLPNGNISSQNALRLADAAENTDAVLRINLEHGLEIYGEKSFQLPESLAGFLNNPIIVACPGSRTCSKALVDCSAAADRIRNRLSGQSLPNLRINISGCPNNCAQSAIADIGLVGSLRKEFNRRESYYRVFKGGGNGANNKLGKMLYEVRERELADIIEKLTERC